MILYQSINICKASIDRSTYRSIYRSISPSSLYLSSGLFVGCCWLSTGMSVYVGLFVCALLCLSGWLFCLFVLMLGNVCRRLFMCAPLFDCRFICLSVCRSVCFVCLPVCLIPLCECVCVCAGAGPTFLVLCLCVCVFTRVSSVSSACACVSCAWVSVSFSLS